MSDQELGEFGPWELSDLHSQQGIACYQKTIIVNVYKHPDGSFTASYDDAWVDGVFDSFEEAERAALGIE